MMAHRFGNFSVITLFKLFTIPFADKYYIKKKLLTVAGNLMSVENATNQTSKPV